MAFKPVLAHASCVFSSLLASVKSVKPNDRHIQTSLVTNTLIHNLVHIIFINVCKNHSQLNVAHKYWPSTSFSETMFTLHCCHVIDSAHLLTYC